CLFFFFQAEDGIRDFHVTGVQTCALPIFHCNLEAENAVVQVINYGHSIPPEELPYIFDMFYTVDKARTEREGSSGIGLFIAKNIVEQHRGTISAQSAPVRTLFEVRLPTTNAPEAQR